MFAGANRVYSGDEAMAAHRELVQYWMSKCKDGQLPGRQDIHPRDFIKHLPTISLIEIDEADQTSDSPQEDVAHTAANPDAHYKMRLAGTGLRDIYEGEITGKTLSEVYPEAQAQYWRQQLSEVRERAKPAAGAAPLDWKGKDHLVQLWLRLPLASDGKRVNMILAFDAVVAAGQKAA